MEDYLQLVIHLVSGDYGPGGMTLGFMVVVFVVMMVLWGFEGIRILLSKD